MAQRCREQRICRRWIGEKRRLSRFMARFLTHYIFDARPTKLTANRITCTER